MIEAMRRVVTLLLARTLGSRSAGVEMIGPGKYGAEAEALAQKLDADAVAVFVWNGVRGPGLSVAMNCDYDFAAADPAAFLDLPGILRKLADDIERNKGK